MPRPDSDSAPLTVALTLGHSLREKGVDDDGVCKVAEVLRNNCTVEQLKCVSVVRGDLPTRLPVVQTRLDPYCHRAVLVGCVNV